MGSLAHSKKRDFLLNNDNLYQNVFYLAWPIVIQSLLQVSIGTIDLKMVGSLGEDAIAAVGSGRNIVMLMMVLVMGISTGTTAMVARNIGKGDRESASLSAGQSFFLCLLAAAFMVPFGLLTNRFSLQILGVSDAVLTLSVQYMTVFFLSIPFFLLNFIARAIFQGAGDTKTPLVIDIIMNITNVIFNYFFIFGIWIFPEMGVMGAAIGTAISRLVGATLGWSALLSGRFILHVKLEHMIKPIWENSKQIINIGLPAAFQGLSRNASTFLIFAILARTAAQSLAITAFSIGTNLSQYALMPGLAIGTAAATLSGMNIGAKKLDRAEASGKACTILGAGLMIFFASIFVFFAEPLINFFLDTPNPEVVRIGKNFLYIIALSEPFHAMTIILSRTMQGAGYTKYPFYITLVCWVGIRVSLAYILAFVFNLQSTGVWLAISASTFASGMLNYSLFKMGKWKYVRIKEKTVAA
ncbi:MATE family efflux transporter [Alkalicella caledoniensis]|uniref:Probable multidrug resistance protein NorM n=1 Tax=Alkalicella caledoniensis TaxID=2731377 RepID=A0A7G9WA88_ALKCA|nr:MATE family efflux transporter [Alkalicella caledoniensis]QNO15600.1 MATE family efflux transporter [Alkalicella caledoniensis]